MLGSANSFLTLVVAIVITVLILYLCYILSKVLSKKFSNMSMSNNMKILERVALAQDKGLVIARICGKLYLISFANNAIEILKELSEEDYSCQETSLGMGLFSGFKRNLQPRKSAYGLNPQDVLSNVEELPDKLYVVGYANDEIEIIKELDRSEMAQANLSFGQRWLKSFKLILKQRLGWKANEKEVSKEEYEKN